MNLKMGRDERVHLNDVQFDPAPRPTTMAAAADLVTDRS